jgi:uncharacterized protein (TIGR02679 family)
MKTDAAFPLEARVAALCEAPGWDELLRALRGRLEHGGFPATVTLPDMDSAARRALADLLGHRAMPGRRPRVTMHAVDQALRASRLGAGLEAVLEAYAGPLVDRREQRAAERDGWARLHEGLAAHPVVRARPELSAWVAGLRSDGLLSRLGADLAAAEALAETALAVIARLPAGGRSLAVLAASTAGDAHALDAGAPVSTLVLRAVAAMTGERGLPASAAGRRRSWARVGVICDPLSSDVLVLNLRAGGSGLVAETLGRHSEVGEPLRLTLRALERHAPAFGADTLHVCENPAVLLAAADELGARARPLVCTAGMPGAAADYVLGAVQRAGGTLRFHADFDWGGVRIGNLLAARHGAVAWRMSAADFESGLAGAVQAAELTGASVAASWDDALAPVMERAGRALVEEQILGDLLADLG